MAKKFEFTKTVDFCDVDMGGGLYHPNYYKYLDTARVAALAEVGIPFKSFFASNSALVVVAIDSKFIAPAFFEENLRITTEVVSIGSSSLKLSQMVYKISDSGPEQRPIHTSEVTLAHVSLLSKKATPIPQALIDRLQ